MIPKQKAVLAKLSEKGWLSWTYTTPQESRALTRLCQLKLARFNIAERNWEITDAGKAELIGG